VSRDGRAAASRSGAAPGRPAGGYERLLRPALFRIGGGDAEAAHERTLRLLGRVPRRLADAAATAAGRRSAPDAARTVFGVRFANPVGLAAGMDKDGVALPAWPALGFGFVEVGTVTWHAQPGNPRPRLFRLGGSGALINRMGFNNAGAAALAARLERYGPLPVPLGISLGKSRRTPLEEAVGDYLASFDLLYRYGDYFAVNVSSPNTPGLRRLQGAAQLGTLLAALRAHAAGRSGPPRPVLVKISPDLPEPAIADALAVCLEHQVAGVIATNTTTARTGLAAADVATGARQPGGLSGAPLAARARQVVAFVHAETGGRLPVVASGGICSAQAAARMFDAGASLVQLYTGLVYHGPGLVRAIARTAPAMTGQAAASPEATGPEPAGQGATSQRATGSGATGSGATGRGATGSGATGRGATGQRATGPEAAGSEAAGSAGSPGPAGGVAGAARRVAGSAAEGPR
jgi:dihydroorotate dehydrogenase